MTEQDWMTATKPFPLLDGLDDQHDGPTARKIRLFMVACCRRVWDVMLDERSRRAVDVAEQAADGLVTPSILDRISGEAEEVFEYLRANPGESESITSRAHQAANAALWATRPDLNPEIVKVGCLCAAVAGDDYTVELARQADLLRELFGNPFRPVAIVPHWRTATVSSLAAGTYYDRAFDRLPILADALEDAGCDATDLLAHLRSAGPHVRGCWALDLVLGKS